MLLIVAAIVATAATPVGPLHMPPVDYRPASLKAGEHGRVGYRVTVTAKGKLHQCAIVESSGFTRLDEATCALLKKATAEPATRDGRASAGTRTGVITWNVGDPASPAAVPDASR